MIKYEINDENEKKLIVSIKIKIDNLINIIKLDIPENNNYIDLLEKAYTQLVNEYETNFKYNSQVVMYTLKYMFQFEQIFFKDTLIENYHEKELHINSILSECINSNKPNTLSFFFERVTFYYFFDYVDLFKTIIDKSIKDIKSYDAMLNVCLKYYDKERELNLVIFALSCIYEEPRTLEKCILDEEEKDPGSFENTSSNKQIYKKKYRQFNWLFKKIIKRSTKELLRIAHIYINNERVFNGIYKRINKFYLKVNK